MSFPGNYKKNPEKVKAGLTVLSPNLSVSDQSKVVMTDASSVKSGFDYERQLKLLFPDFVSQK